MSYYDFCSTLNNYLIKVEAIDKQNKKLEQKNKAAKK